MYTIVSNTGDYWELPKCTTREQAELYMGLKFSQEEISEHELEVIDISEADE